MYISVSTPVFITFSMILVQNEHIYYECKTGLIHYAFIVCLTFMLHCDTKSCRQHLFTIMEWGEIEKKICCCWPTKMQIPRNFVYRAIKLFEDTGGLRDHKRSGHP